MTAEIDPRILWMEQVTSLLRTLGQQMVSCRQEFTAMQLDKMYLCISEQEESCRRLRALSPAADSVGGSLAEQGKGAPIAADAGVLQRWHDTRSEFGRAWAEANRLNQIQAAYLRRGSRTIAILTNALAASPTYTPAGVTFLSHTAGAD